MKAAVLRGFHEPLQIENGAFGELGPGRVRVKTAASGVCRSDLHVIDELWPIFRPPIVLGHEASGVVEEVGEGVTYVELGDHVVLLWAQPCGNCQTCLAGQLSLCLKEFGKSQPLQIDQQAVARFAGVGSFAECTVVPENGLVKISSEMPLDKAALIGCAVMTGVGAAVNIAKVQPGSTCAVIGCGGVGLNVIQGCDLAGARRIIAVDIQPAKLELAKRFGATDIVDASVGDPVAAVQNLCEGGSDYAFEVIGLPKFITQAFNMVRRGGVAVIVGMAPLGSTAEVDATGFFAGKSLVGCCYGDPNPRHDVPMLIDLYLAGKLNLDDLVSRTISLEQVNEAFEAMRKGEEVRSIIVFDQ